MGLDPLVEPDRVPAGLFATGNSRQMVTQLRALPHRLQTDLGEAFDFQGFACLEAGHLQAGTDRLQQIVEVVGDAGGELTQRGYALGMPQGRQGLLVLTQHIVQLTGQGKGLFLALFVEQAQFQLCCGLPGQGLQGIALRHLQRARHGVDDADGAQCRALARDDRRASIETNVGRAQDERALLEARVEMGVRHYHHGIGRQNGMGAERQVAVGLGNVEPYTGLEPLTFAVHQRHQANGRCAQLRCQLDDIVETRLRRTVQHTQMLERSQTFGLVDRRWGRAVSHAMGQVEEMIGIMRATGHWGKCVQAYCA